jgi:hypothetical protein
VGSRCVARLRLVGRRVGVRVREAIGDYIVVAVVMVGAQRDG